MRVDARHVLDRGGIRQQVLANPQPDLAADDERRLAHEIERAAHRALGRVLDRDHRIVGLTRLRGAKDLVDRRAGLGLDEAPEVLGDRRVRKRSGGTEIRDAQRLLERETRRHHLAEDTGNRFVRQRSAVFRLQPREDLGLALGPVGGAARLQRADRLRVRGARIERREQLRSILSIAARCSASSRSSAVRGFGHGTLHGSIAADRDRRVTPRRPRARPRARDRRASRPRRG